MPSANNTYEMGSGATVTDAQGTVYAINRNGRITINGVVDRTTGRVDGLGYGNGLVWQKNADNMWYSKASAKATWANFDNSNGPPMAVPAGFISTNSFHDGNGKSWGINATGQIVVDGKADLTTARVIKLVFVNGVVWQENLDGNWYSKVQPSNTWTQATKIDPSAAALANTLTWNGASTNPTLANAWSLPNGAHQAPVAHETLIMKHGSLMNLGGGNLAGDTLHTISTPGQVSVADTIINMTAGGSLKIDAGGDGSATTQVHVTGGGTAAVNIDAPYYGANNGSDVVVTADTISAVLLHANISSFHHLTVNAPVIDVEGYSHFSGTHVLLNGNLVGNGTLAVTFLRSVTGGDHVVEVNGAIGSGVTLAGDRASNLILDNAMADHGRITLQNAMLEIRNLAAADHVSYKNSLVSLYQGTKLLTAINVAGLVDPDASPFNPAYGSSDGGLSFGKSASSGSVLVESYAGAGGVHALDFTTLTARA